MTIVSALFLLALFVLVFGVIGTALWLLSTPQQLADWRVWLARLAFAITHPFGLGTRKARKHHNNHHES